jgi:malate synthase
MTAFIAVNGIEVAAPLHGFVADEVLPGLTVDAAAFWRGFAQLVTDLTPPNRVLLARRDALQSQIDGWHRRQGPGPHDANAYQAMLQDSGYLQPERGEFQVSTANVDAEIASIAGPQLVVPVTNARYALNAANARWGSLYDALYGTDALPEDGGAQRGASYNPARGARVIAYGRDFLDRHLPLARASWRDVAVLTVAADGLTARLRAGLTAALADPGGFAGFQGEPSTPDVVLLRHHGLHVEIHIDRASPVGRADAAGISDLVLESAVTTIQDFEDSVATVDAADKVAAYRNWLGLMRGTLSASFERDGRTRSRTLNADRRYRDARGGEVVLPGRSLMLVRNVGHHMFTDMVRWNGQQVPETFVDATVTSLIAMHDLAGAGPVRNSRTGSIYIVKPKMHGPEEVAFAVQLLARVEQLLQLPRCTLKMGIMDEERRTSVNLKECIRAAAERVVFINTGFLDRTGDEIHTSMEAGAMVRKNEMKSARWLDAYERSNVDVGLACGLRGRAQIGKGMWAMPDLMASMLKTKSAQLRAGASTAWVPSPTAATLHALHYHEVEVAAVQTALATRTRASIDEILTPPLSGTGRSPAEIQEELNNNAQSILGYVVRWVESGVGCSKVPDYFDVALMEDRATLRISSQHLANWLHHGVVTPAQVMATLRRMAQVVDRQNAAEPGYRPMSADYERSLAFRAAGELIFDGRVQPNGYTEAILTRWRRAAKEQTRPA